MTDDWTALLHEWVVTSEHDAGYVLGRCRVCGLEELLDVDPAKV